MIRSLFFIAFITAVNISAGLGQHAFSVKDSLIQQSPLMIPNDYLGEISPWNIATTDGFTYLINSNNYGFYGPQPVFYVDGLPADISFFGWQNINMLPVSVEDIHSFTYGSHPQIYNDYQTGAGYLDFKTVSPDTGLSVSGSVALINKIEDPGPWLYDSTKVTPNVDRWGFNVTSRVSYKKPDWYTKAHFSYREHQPTTLMNYHRNAVYYPVNENWYPIKTRIFNGLGEVGYNYRKWTVRARIIQSDNIDFIFFHPLGREIPSNPFYRQLAFEGSYRSQNWTFNGRYLADQKDLKYRINSEQYDFNWRQFKQNFSLSARYQKPDLKIKAGSIYKVSTTNTSAIEDYQKSFLEVFGKLEKEIRLNYRLFSTVNLEFTGDGIAPTVLLGLKYRIGQVWQLSLDGNYAELLPFQQGNSVYWIQRGYSLFSDLGIPQQVPLSSQENKLFKLKLNNTVLITPALKLQIAGQYIHNIALNIPWQIFTYRNRTSTLPGEFSYTSESGDRTVFNLGVTHKISESISQEMNGTAQFISDGSKRYKRYWDQVPRLKLNYKVDYRPVEDLLLSTETTLQSSARWWEYQDLDGKQYFSVEPFYPRQSGTYHIQTPKYLNINLNVKKWFWDRRFITTFSIRNLLNTEIRTHTLGTDLKLRFMVKGTLQL